MEIPRHLNHKPVIMLEDYDSIDGIYKKHTDAVGLSIGIAQWSVSDDTKQISAKVWRHSGNKWSRQSEEMPLHRVLDLAALVCAAYSFNKDGFLPNFEDFELSKSKDSTLIEQFQEGMSLEAIQELESSFERLAKYMEKIGYLKSK